MPSSCRSYFETFVLCSGKKASRIWGGIWPEFSRTRRHRDFLNPAHEKRPIGSNQSDGLLQERGFSGTRSNSRGSFLRRAIVSLALRSQGSVLLSQGSGWAQGSHSEPILSLDGKDKQRPCQRCSKESRASPEQWPETVCKPLQRLHLTHFHDFSLTSRM